MASRKAPRRAPRKAVPDMRDKSQVTVRMTEQFAKDMNLIMASYKFDDASYVVRESVACQADAIRKSMAARRLAMQKGEANE